MMKHKNNRFIFLNEAFHFYDPIISNFRCFVSLFLIFANNLKDEKATQLFQLLKNQHLDKMLVFFCNKIRGLYKQPLKNTPLDSQISGLTSIFLLLIFPGNTNLNNQ